MVCLLRDHRQLIGQLARRQVDARFRGSYFGRLLAFLNPLVLLGVYTLVFTKFLPIADPNDRVGFALRLFSSILLFTVFSETVSRAPTLVVGNPNYVKKVVFPLEVLPVAEMVAAAVLAGGNLVILLLALILTGKLGLMALAFPLVVPPLVMTTLGVAWIVAAVGVYVRDIASSMGVLLTILFYLTPIFYELDQFGSWRWLAELNPLAAVIDSGRRTLVMGGAPDGWGLVLSWVGGALVAYVGFVWFRLSKRGFADVL
jgi:lipopolysaccharide transport system permease protein